MNREDARPAFIEATRSALHEIADIFDGNPGATIIGGTVPYLLIPQGDDPHQGTIDIDIVLDPNRLTGDPVLTLHTILINRNFVQDTRKPYKFWKEIKIGIEDHLILIEFLGGGTRSRDGLISLPSHDVYLSVIAGLEVAHDHRVEIRMPGSDSVLNVASIPAFLTMKASALSLRSADKKTKDAYDIIYCLRTYPGGVTNIAQEYLAVIEHPLISRGKSLLADLFATTDSLGPAAYSQQSTGQSEQALLRREAYERVSDLLDLLPYSSCVNSHLLCIVK